MDTNIILHCFNSGFQGITSDIPFFLSAPSFFSLGVLLVLFCLIWGTNSIWLELLMWNPLLIYYWWLQHHHYHHHRHHHHRRMMTTAKIRSNNWFICTNRPTASIQKSCQLYWPHPNNVYGISRMRRKRRKWTLFVIIRRCPRSRILFGLTYYCPSSISIVSSIAAVYLQWPGLLASCRCHCVF